MTESARAATAFPAWSGDSSEPDAGIDLLLPDRPTLVGVITGRVDGPVAILRLSGPRAHEIAAGLWGERTLKARVATLVTLTLRSGPEQALVLWMPGPHTFTGEDVVELQVHGGLYNVRELAAALIGAGAQAAGPGEFSRRAFESGRASLDELEGFAAVIGARTLQGLRLARRLAHGELGDEVTRLAEELAELRVEVEGSLDFVEDVGDASRDAIHTALCGWCSRLKLLREGAIVTQRARERFRVVIAGPPNAGKSSLQNALLGQARSLVDAQPGTTRDYVESELVTHGIELTLVDTAGLRHGETGVERLGIERSIDELRRASLVVWLEPGDSLPQQADILAARQAAGLRADLSVPQPCLDERAGDEDSRASEETGLAPVAFVDAVIYVESKRDLGRQREHWVGVTVHDPISVAELAAQLSQHASKAGDGAWIGLARHEACVGRAYEELCAAIQELDVDALELCAARLAAAERHLREITGRDDLGPVGERVLAQIFATFCIGK